MPEDGSPRDYFGHGEMPRRKPRQRGRGNASGSVEMRSPSSERKERMELPSGSDREGKLGKNLCSDGREGNSPKTGGDRPPRNRCPRRES